MAFYELRQYKVRPGKMAEWLKIMEEEIIPFQVAKGMVITGSYRGETDDSVYVWTRRFESEAQREALYKAVYESDHWKEIAPRIADLLDRAHDHGKGVHEAARIAALAEASEILVSRETADGTSFKVSEPRMVELRGISKPMEVVTVSWR